jgi:hypothetical protein
LRQPVGDSTEAPNTSTKIKRQLRKTFNHLPKIQHESRADPFLRELLERLTNASPAAIYRL